MLEWIRSWQADTATLANDAAMIVRCGTWRDGFDPGLDLDDDVLGRVHAPTLIVAARHDPVGGEEIVRALAGRLAHADVELMKGAGHLPWLDDPVGVAALTSSFLSAGEPRPDVLGPPLRGVPSPA